MEAVKDDPHMPTINAVVHQITQELKQILKKDFNKKMVENTAFKKFETWWEEESSKEHKVSKNVDDATADKAAEKSKDSINILLEANRENLYSNISLDNLGFGLGLRASLPKMPSFRRKKIPSPVPEDEDSRKLSDNEEIVHDSDSEQRPRPRKVSSSSSGSSDDDTSSASSESDSSSSDESSSETEEETTERRARSRTPIERTTPIPAAPLDFTMSPIHDGIEATNKTPEPMQLDTDDGGGRLKEPPIEMETGKLEKLMDSDSDMSEGEREYMERRRRNTEWMEQIERERLEREAQRKAMEPKEEAMEVTQKEEKVEEESVVIDTRMQLAADKTTDEERAEARRDKKKDVKDLNGDLELRKRLSSESGVVENSSKSQVRDCLLICLFLRELHCFLHYNLKKFHSFLRKYHYLLRKLHYCLGKLHYYVGK